MFEDNARLMAAEIKKKKSLSSVDDSLVIERIAEYANKHPAFRKFMEAEHTNIARTRLFKDAFSEIRKDFHKQYAVFQVKSSSEKDTLLGLLAEELKARGLSDRALGLHSDIMATHMSTEERDFYPKLYKAIFKITGKPKTIADLGCGLNPLSFPWMGLESVDYTAAELNKSDVDFLGEYFRMMKSYGLNGKVSKLDLAKMDDNSYADKNKDYYDVCFLFKVLPTVEKAKKGISKYILDAVPADWIVVSFPVESMKKKFDISAPRREWFEKLIAGAKFETIEFKNEVFYVIRKKG